MRSLVLLLLCVAASPSPVAANEPLNDALRIDLDGDGAPEWLRDAAIGAPHDNCGLPHAWVTPEVWDPSEARFRRVRIPPPLVGVPQIDADANAAPSRAPLELRLVPTFASSALGVPAPAGGPGDPFDLRDGPGWRPAGRAAGNWLRVHIPIGWGEVALQVEVTSTTTLLIAHDGHLASWELDPEHVQAARLPAGTRCVALQVVHESASPDTPVLRRVVVAPLDATDSPDAITWARARWRAQCQDSATPIPDAAVLWSMLGTITMVESDVIDPDPCVADHAATVVAQSPASDPQRARAAALATGAARERIVATSALPRQVWVDAVSDPTLDRALLLDQALRADGPPTSSAVWPIDPTLDARFDALAHGVDVATLAPVSSLPTDIATARRMLAVLAQATGDAAPWVQALVDTAKEHDDGTVARLALVVSARFASIQCHCAAMVRTDPSPHLRAAAFVAWSAEQTDRPAREAMRLALLRDDPSPTVRLVAAEATAAPLPPDEWAPLLANERWPEVRHALLNAWLSEDDHGAVAAHLRNAPAGDVAAVALAVRGTSGTAADALLLVAARTDLDAVTIGRLVGGILPNAPPTGADAERLEALVTLHLDHPDVQVRRAMLDALAAEPDAQRRRAEVAQHDENARIRAQAAMILERSPAAE